MGPNINSAEFRGTLISKYAGTRDPYIEIGRDQNQYLGTSIPK